MDIVDLEGVSQHLPLVAFLDFTMRPWAQKLAWIVGIVGLLLGVWGIYLARESLANRQLSYYVVPSAAQIVKAGQSSGLSVAFNGQLVTTDISAIQVVVWNAGKLSVRPENVLKPLVITTESERAVLEATIRVNSRDVTGAWLDLSEMTKGRVGVRWNILEKNDGVSLQIILAGPPETKINAEGTVEGQNQIYRVLTAPKKGKGNLASVYLSISLTACAIAFGLWIDAWNNAKLAAQGRTQSRLSKILDWLYLITMFVLLVINIIALFPSAPPDALL